MIIIRRKIRYVAIEDLPQFDYTKVIKRIKRERDKNEQRKET